MTPDAILSAFGSGPFPTDALRAAVGEAEALTPIIVGEVERAATGRTLLPADERTVFYGLAALGAARRTALYRPVLRLLALPEHRLAPYCGRDPIGFQAAVLISVFDGDPAPLLAAIEDRAIEGDAKWALFIAAARLVFDGRMPRAPFVDLLDRFDRDEMALPDDLAWEGWQEAIRLLGLTGMAARVKAGWQAGRVGDPDDDAGELDDDAEPDDDTATGEDVWTTALAWSAAHPGDPAAFEEARIRPIDDPVDVLDVPLHEGAEAVIADLAARIEAGTISAGAVDLAAIEYELRHDPGLSVEQLRDPRVRPDPLGIAEDDPEAPTAGDLEWLARFLEGPEVRPGTMSLEVLDGFLTALAIGPVAVPAEEEWLPAVWGEEGPPRFADADQERFVMAVLARHAAALGRRAEQGRPPDPYVPFGAADERPLEWAVGFLEGIDFREAAWQPLFDEPDADALLAPIEALAYEEGAYEEGADEESESGDDELEALPGLLMEIQSYWRRPARVPVRSTKVGRNDPCPCGSGKKYKKCHGANT